MDSEMIEMMKFYEFYKKMKDLEKTEGLTSKPEVNTLETEGANENNAINEGFYNNKTDGDIKSYKRKNYKATRPLDIEEYEQIINLCKSGFTYGDKNTWRRKKFRPNPSLAFALALQATLGFRASDIVNLKVEDFNRSKFSIKEIKTGKWQNRDLGENIYNKFLEYVVENKLSKSDYIYPNKVRNMQQQLKIITDYLDYKNIGTHSFRKLFAHTLYEESGHDIELVRHVLNHSDIKTTMRYLGVSMKKLKEVTTKIDFSYML